MNRRIYFLIILYLLKHKNLYNIINFNLKILDIENKILINYFFKLKFNISENLIFFKTLKNEYTSFYNIIKHTHLNKQSQFTKNIAKNTHFFYSLKLKDLLYDKKNLQKYFDYYCKYYVLSMKPRLNYKNFNYIDFIIDRRNKASVLFLFMLKKRFFKIANLIINSSFMNLKPLVVGDCTSDKFLINPELFNKYTGYLNNNSNYDYVIILNPKLKIKNLKKILDLNLPIMSIVDDTINSNWIDYPLEISKIDEFSIFFFFTLYINLFCVGLHIKKKYNTKLYYEFFKFNFLKEYLLKKN